MRDVAEMQTWACVGVSCEMEWEGEKEARVVYHITFLDWSISLFGLG